MKNVTYGILERFVPYRIQVRVWKRSEAVKASVTFFVRSWPLS